MKLTNLNLRWCGMKTPILETDRLILRPFNTADAQDVFCCWESEWCGIKKVDSLFSRIS